MSVNFFRRVVKHSAVLFLTSHGFSQTVAEEAEPATLARTAYHVLTAWIAVTAARMGAAARSLGGSPLIRYLPAFIQPFFLQPAPQRSRKRPTT